MDALVNCAGDWLIAPIDDTDNARLDHILRLNLRAPYILTRLLLPNLRRSDNASVINIGSIVTALSVPGVSAYTASKVGLKGLTGALAAELRADEIRVVMISPGPADTPMRPSRLAGYGQAPAGLGGGCGGHGGGCGGAAARHHHERFYAAFHAAGMCNAIMSVA